MSASNGFLDIIRSVRGDGDYSGDEFGGATSPGGQGLPGDDGSTFIFATGIECSYPTIGQGKVRRDQLAECGHYDRWRDDLRLVRELGLKFLRYGLPYHRVHLGPGRYDFEFADLVMAEMQKLGITPILDLLHFGVPDWLGNFQNPELPIHFSDYADAVAERYPHVRYWTPVNEIYVAARISARDGVWNEQLKSDRAFVTALKHLSAASILATHAIAKRRPDSIIVQSESAEYTHEMRAIRSKANTIDNKSRFIALDLLYAHPPDADICTFLMDNGLTRDEYEWFMVGEPPGFQVLGSDYYGRNERMIKPDGSMCPAEDVLGWHQIIKQYHRRYMKPIMYTETNVFDPAAAPVWLWKQWCNVLLSRSEGIPVIGFTWYSLTDQIDWDIQLGELKGVVQGCGLFDLERNPREVAQEYRALLAEFGQISMMPYGEMFTVTNAAARIRGHT